MTYNTDRRKPLTKKQRAAFLAAHAYTCHWCRELITDDLWDDEHIIPREMFPPGGGADEMTNRAPIHRGECHKQKTRQDRKAIAKSNRLRRANGPVEQRRQPRQKIQTRGFQQGGRKIQSRPFTPRRST